MKDQIRSDQIGWDSGSEAAPETGPAGSAGCPPLPAGHCSGQAPPAALRGCESESAAGSGPGQGGFLRCSTVGRVQHAMLWQPAAVQRVVGRVPGLHCHPQSSQEEPLTDAPEVPPIHILIHIHIHIPPSTSSSPPPAQRVCTSLEHSAGGGCENGWHRTTSARRSLCNREGGSGD